MQVLWHKRDLRVTDNIPLFKALSHTKTLGQTLPIYIHEPSVIFDKYTARQHQCFIHECLDELSEHYESIGGHLHEFVGEAVTVLDYLHKKYGITAIWAHRETTQRTQFERDMQVVAWAKKNSVPFNELMQNNVIRGSEPDSMKLSFQQYFDNATQEPIKIPFGKDLSAHFHPRIIPKLDRSEVPTAKGEDKPLRPKGGRSNAKLLADDFFTYRKLRAYPYSISSPLKAIEGCSRLSPYLAYGVVSDREVMQKLNNLIVQCHGRFDQEQFEKIVSAARFYLDRLQWRHGYHQQFEHHPELEDKEFYPAFENARESEFREDFFEAWKTGRTGVPYIDAIQRCLDQTGWINMRARACLVSYACMQLWLPWPKVMEHLAHQFVDFDMAIHAGQHRIASGTSLFSQLLIYNPLKQATDHDQDCVFVKRWVPEIREIPNDKAHYPWMLRSYEQSDYNCVIGKDYPAPLVDNRIALQTAKERVDMLRSEQANPQLNLID